jgi:hypothetical protein
MDADVAITKNAINLKYEDLPSDVVEPDFPKLVSQLQFVQQ